MLLTRRELYDLVWSKPLDALAVDLGITDRGLSKLCARHSIPLPGQGYWLLKAKPARPALPTLRKPAPIVIERHPVVPPQHGLRREARRAAQADPPGYIATKKAHHWIRASVSALRRPGQDIQMAIAHGDGLCGVACRKVDVYRGVRLLDGLARALEPRGLTLRPAGDRMTIALGQDEIDVRLGGGEDGYFAFHIIGGKKAWRDTEETLIERLVPRIAIELEVALRDTAARRAAVEALLVEKQERKRDAAERERQWLLAGIWSHLDRLAEDSTAFFEVQAWIETWRSTQPKTVIDLLESSLAYAKARQNARPPAR